MPETFKSGDAPRAKSEGAEGGPGAGFDPEAMVQDASWSGRLYELLGMAIEATNIRRYGANHENSAPDPRVLAAIAAYRSHPQLEGQSMGTDVQLISPPVEGPGTAESTRDLDLDDDFDEPRADLSRTAGAWVYISAFIGIALAWSTSFVAPWIGGVLGATVAVVAGTWVIATRS